MRACTCRSAPSGRHEPPGRKAASPLEERRRRGAGPQDGGRGVLVGSATTNAYLALCVAFANDLAWLSVHAGADPSDVAAGLRADPRVSPSAPLRRGRRSRERP